MLQAQSARFFVNSQAFQSAMYTAREARGKYGICIGNAKYADSSYLRYARKDASDMANFLHQAVSTASCPHSFVFEPMNKTRQQILEELHSYDARLSKIAPEPEHGGSLDSLAVVHYSGHAQSNATGAILMGTDWNTKIADEWAYRMYGVDLSHYIRLLADSACRAAAGLVVILDACRVLKDLPADPAKGRKPTNVLMVYSCGLDEEACDNNSYTQTLLQVLQSKPEISIFDAICEANSRFLANTENQTPEVVMVTSSPFNQLSLRRAERVREDWKRRLLGVPMAR